MIPAFYIYNRSPNKNNIIYNLCLSQSVRSGAGSFRRKIAINQTDLVQGAGRKYCGGGSRGKKESWLQVPAKIGQMRLTPGATQAPPEEHLHNVLPDWRIKARQNFPRRTHLFLPSRPALRTWSILFSKTSRTFQGSSSAVSL